MRRPWRLATMDAGTRALLNANVAQGMVAYQGRPVHACASTRSDVASGMKERVSLGVGRARRARPTALRTAMSNRGVRRRRVCAACSGEWCCSHASRVAMDAVFDEAWSEHHHAIFGSTNYSNLIAFAAVALLPSVSTHASSDLARI